MSNPPPSETENKPNDQEVGGGWRQPDTSSAWRAPEKAAWRPPEEAKPAAAVWRVSTLPQDMSVVPEQAGAWHLPKPEHTTYTAEDVSVLTAPPSEAAKPAAVETEEAPLAEAAAGEALPFDQVEAGEKAPEPEKAEALPFDDELIVTTGELEEALAEEAPAAEAEDEEEEDTFSMSELVALASLADQAPAAEIVQGAPAAAEQPAELSPEEYARQQLAKIAAEAMPAGATEAVSPTSQVLTPEEYARQQLEQLGTSQPVAPAGEAAPAVPALTPAQQALAQKYKDTESKVRVFREQFKAGQITRDQLQAELRQLMVLDEGNVWWMMGVETDNWYKYDNGQWVLTTPPVLEQLRAAEAAAAAPSAPGVTDAQPTVPTQPILQEGALVPSQPIGVGEDYMPLPRAVPLRDPEATMPNTVGFDLPGATVDLGATIPSGAAQPTVPSPGYGAEAAEQGYFDEASIPAAADTTEPPAYELDVEAPAYKQALERQRQAQVSLAVRLGLVAIALVLLVSACGIIGALTWYNSVASPWQNAVIGLANYQPEFQTARILDAEGNLIVELTSQEGGARKVVALQDISPFMVHAVVSLENERFFEDPGWDPIAISRAFLQNLTAGEIESGASTITQQIARNLILQDTSATAERKLQEIVIAAEIARRYDKNFILQLYLNEVFFGNQSYGVEAAAEFYFNKTAADLNLAESAMLAGLIQAPATYDPVVNRQQAFDRMKAVVAQMVKVNCLNFQHPPYQAQPFCLNPARRGTPAGEDLNTLVITDSNGNVVSGQVIIQEAEVVATSFEAREFRVKYPHFVNFIQSQIEQSFGTAEMFRRGFTIRTTLMPRIQDVAQTALETQVQQVVNTGINTGAVMVVDPTTGAIRAMVGSPDFENKDIGGQVNNVLTWQQPGSSIKPVTYIGAFEGVTVNNTPQYLTPASILWDVPTTYNTTPPYTPVNFDRRYRGPVAVRFALANSYNVPAVKAFEFIGVDKFRDVATRMGLRFLDEAVFGLPSALGANEIRLYDHMAMYATIANNGMRVPFYAITSITDASGVEVPLPERQQPVQAVQPQIAYLMQSILSDNQARSAAFGLNSGLTIQGLPTQDYVGAKTGTSNNNSDLWTMGFTRNLVVGVWMGTAPNNNPTTANTSVTTIPVWNAVMRAALQGTNVQPFSNPGGVISMQVCTDTGTAYDPNRCTNARNELFLQTAPPPPADQSFVVRTTVDTWTGLIANEYCSESVEERTFVNIPDPWAIQWLQSSAGAAVAQVLGLPTPIQGIPTQACSLNTQLPNIRLVQPSDGQQIQGTVAIVGSVIASDLNRYQIEVAPVDGNAAPTFTIVAGPFNTQQNPGSTIAQWDTTKVNNGIYRLRLAAFSNSGGFVYRTVQVGVNNPLPTATPSPTATEFLPPTVMPGFTPLPFDTPGGLPFESSGPTPTPEVPTL